MAGNLPVATDSPVTTEAANKSFGEVKTPNLYGLPQSASQGWNSTLDDVTSALQGRYAKPNWFDVAAGFARPQLGGFMASLGSANEAMARNVEQQRAQELTIAQIRLAKANNEILQQHRAMANQTYDEALAKSQKTGEPISDTDYGNIVAHVGKDDPIAQAAEKRSETYLANLRGKIDVGTFALKGIEAAQQNKFVKFTSDNVNNPGFFSTLSPEEAKTEEAKLDKNLLKVTTPEALASMNIYDKQNLLNKVAETNAAKTMDIKQQEAERAKMANSRLSDLNEARHLVTQPGMENLFALFNSGDGLALMKQLAEAKGGGYASAMNAVQEFVQQKFANDNPKLRMQADQLMKLINKLSLDSRNSAMNPTNLVQELANNTNPNFTQSHKGFISILDQMGFEDKYHMDFSKLRNKTKGIDPNEILDTDEAKRLNFKYRRERAEHSGLDPLKHFPSWYVGAENEAPAIVNQPTAQPNAQPNVAPVNKPQNKAPSEDTTEKRAKFLNGLRP